MSSTASDGCRDELTQQLSLTNELLHTFYEWRHKIMIRFFVTAAALVVAMGYIMDSRSLGNWLIAVPGLLGSLVSVGAWRLDKVNGRLMHMAYEHGADVEQRMDLPLPGLFSILRRRSESVEERGGVSYRGTLQVLYIGAAVLFAAGSATAVAALAIWV